MAIFCFAFFLVNFLNVGNPQKENWWEESFFFLNFLNLLIFLNFLNFRDGPKFKKFKKKNGQVFFEFFEFFEFWQSSKRKLVGRVLFF